MTVTRKGSTGNEDPGRLGLVQPDGTFEVRGVRPGSHLLTSRSASDPTKTAGALVLEAADRNIEGIQFRLGGGGEISGRVMIPPDKTASAKDLEIALVSVDFPLSNLPTAKPDAEGKFTLKDVPSVRYQLRVRGMTPTSYVKSIKVGGQEADEGGVELTAGTQLEIAVSLTGATVEGAVTGPDGKPVSGSSVTLIPDPVRESRYRSTITDDKGEYSLKGVAPGKYRMLAWEDVEAGAVHDPAFVKPFESAAEAVTLAEGGTSKTALKAIPFDKVAGEAGAR